MSLKHLPDASGKQHQKVFESLGWITRREGEHIILTRPASPVHLSIPNHRAVKRTTLHAIARNAGLTDEQYRKAFDAL